MTEKRDILFCYCAAFKSKMHVRYLLQQFGGKLVTFECPAAGKPLQTSPQRIVHISQVVTETELVTRSNQLQQALSAGQYLEFCALKASNSASAMEENIWNFLRVSTPQWPSPVCFRNRLNDQAYRRKVV